MKITRVPNDYNMDLYLKQKALDECKVCPFCGEDRPLGFVEKDDGSFDIVGIDDSLCKYDFVKTGFFKREYMKMQVFTCHNCGAMWESKPFKH